MNILKRFLLRLEDGFVLVFTLLVLPALLSLSLLLVDIARISNAHSDLQAVADAAALAGARELDRSPAAINNARLAMAEITNSVSMLGQGGTDANLSLTYANSQGHPIQAVFLDEIPSNDLTPIDQAWLNAHRVADADAEDAVYVFVQVQARDFDPFFHFMNNTGSMTEGADVPVVASAVAKSVSAACNVTPLYICNPFEFDNLGNYQGNGLRDAFRSGNLHSRMIKLHPKGNDTASPGNFGFLQVLNDNGTLSSSADALRDIFAGNRNPTCYDSERVTTKPGAATSIRQGINVRFDIFEGTFTNWNMNSPNSFPISPARNVRKGYRRVVNGNGNNNNNNGNVDPCSTELSTDPAADGLMGFPDDNIMALPNQGIAGASFGNGQWDLITYLSRNYGSSHAATIRTAIMNMPGRLFPLREPSRYEVYLYEQIGDHPAAPGTKLYEYVNTSDTTFGNESGAALCGIDNSIPPTTNPDRRLTFAAMIDCKTHEDQGGGVNQYPVNSYVSVFMTRPMEQNGSIDSTIDIEIVDITGSGTGGVLIDYIREEAVLVR